MHLDATCLPVSLLYNNMLETYQNSNSTTSFPSGGIFLTASE